MRPSSIGIGWRPELALFIERSPEIGFVEILAENHHPDVPPFELLSLVERGVTVVVHGVGLSLGSAEQLDMSRVAHLSRLAGQFSSPLVSEHIAFVRAGETDSGHLLPMPRTHEAVSLLTEKIRAAQKEILARFAVENISSLFEWPDDEMDEPEFVTKVVEGADALCVLDIANVYANAVNHKWDPVSSFCRFPLARLAYVHVGGGVFRDGVYHDTHTHPVIEPVLRLLEELCSLVEVPGVLLERDDCFPDDQELSAELERIRHAVERGNLRRKTNRTAT